MQLESHAKLLYARAEALLLFWSRIHDNLQNAHASHATGINKAALATANSVGSNASSMDTMPLGTNPLYR